MNINLKVGNINQDLGQLLEKYSPNFKKFQAGIVEVKKYILTEKINNQNYYIMSSTADNKNPYNLIITIIGSDQKLRENIMDNIEAKIGVKLREGPEQLKKLYNDLSNLFSF